jgi:hypothetical protein
MLLINQDGFKDSLSSLRFPEIFVPNFSKFLQQEDLEYEAQCC